MLGLILISISRLWWKFESEYYFRNAVLLGKWKLPTIENFKVKLVNVDIRYKDAFEFAGWAFASIAVFGLGGSVFMQIMHYIVTAAAAAVTFIIVVRSNHGLQRVLYAVGMGIGVFVWVVGFTTNIFSVYFGEFVFVIPVVVWVLNQFKLIK